MPLWNDVFNASTPVEEHFLQFILTDDKQRVVSMDYLFPTPIKKAKGVRNEPPEISIVADECDSFEQKVTLNVRAKAPILFFYIDILSDGIQEYQLSDNGFVISEPNTKLIISYPNPGCSGSRLTLGDLQVLTVNQYL